MNLKYLEPRQVLLLLRQQLDVAISISESDMLPLRDHPYYREDLKPGEFAIGDFIIRPRFPDPADAGRTGSEKDRQLF